MAEARNLGYALGVSSCRRGVNVINAMWRLQLVQGNK
jgi:hypothetical protein